TAAYVAACLAGTMSLEEGMRRSAACAERPSSDDPAGWRGTPSCRVTPTVGGGRPGEGSLEPSESPHWPDKVPLQQPNLLRPLDRAAPVSLLIGSLAEPRPPIGHIGSNGFRLECHEQADDHEVWSVMLSSVGWVYCRGVKIDWAAFDRDYPRRKVPLPTYPF